VYYVKKHFGVRVQHISNLLMSTEVL
jgi:hypothetical protein